jgi:hypothetical protein
MYSYLFRDRCLATGLDATLYDGGNVSHTCITSHRHLDSFFSKEAANFKGRGNQKICVKTYSLSRLILFLPIAAKIS